MPPYPAQVTGFCTFCHKGKKAVFYTFRLEEDLRRLLGRALVERCAEGRVRAVPCDRPKPE